MYPNQYNYNPFYQQGCGQNQYAFDNMAYEHSPVKPEQPQIGNPFNPSPAPNQRRQPSPNQNWQQLPTHQLPKQPMPDENQQWQHLPMQHTQKQPRPIAHDQQQQPAVQQYGNNEVHGNTAFQSQAPQAQQHQPREFKNFQDPAQNGPPRRERPANVIRHAVRFEPNSRDVIFDGGNKKPEDVFNGKRHGTNYYVLQLPSGNSPLYTVDYFRALITTYLQQNEGYQRFFTVWSRATCPFCVKAKDFLMSMRDRGVGFRIVDVSHNPNAANIYAAVDPMTGNYDKVPMIFEGTRFIGGWRELKLLFGVNE